eukprot:908349_1
MTMVQRNNLIFLAVMAIISVANGGIKIGCKCPDGSICYHDGTCPSSAKQQDNVKLDSHKNIGYGVNNNFSGLTMVQLLEMNILVSVVSCLLVIAVCLTCYYCILTKGAKKYKTKYEFVENQENEAIIDVK